ncbi:MAG: hypothetical protein JWP47_2656 [Polaromonas sp.]|nr:hypothetical protein [Polaromonas sp.]
MPERIEWRHDAGTGTTPYSPRFADRYRSESGGLDQAQEVFLAGCGLPAAWHCRPQWCVLETGFGLGLNFLVTWLAWRSDPHRPRLLHFVSTEAYPAGADDIVRAALAHPQLTGLAVQLAADLYGLLPGVHRFAFEDGQVLLTLCIGDAKAMLRQQRVSADSVYLDGFSPAKNPDIWDVHTFKAVARCCSRGARVASWTVSRQVRDALAEAGFVVDKTPGVPPKRDNLQGVYNPAWEPKKPPHTAAVARPVAASACLVIGAGLAGAAVAASLARRGWRVLVLDLASTPASGASALPAGLLAPHYSPDDSPLSRLCRSGVRMALQQAERLLKAGDDWQLTGSLQRSADKEPAAMAATDPKGTASFRHPENWAGFEGEAADWVKRSTAEQMRDAGVEATGDSLYFPRSGWVKPASLVTAWLHTPGVTWRGRCRVARLAPGSRGWQALDDNGTVIAEAPLVVLATAFDSLRLAEGLAPLSLQAIRGQVSFGLHADAGDNVVDALPPLPLNGSGSLIPAVPLESGMAWLAGATYQRNVTTPVVTRQDHQDNLRRLQALHPAAAAGLVAGFEADRVAGWSGVRCATPTRMPLVGRLATHAAGEVWISTGMGSRGLTLSALCGELLAAQLHGEPLPIELSLANSLNPVG